jgi:hypothetical protein
LKSIFANNKKNFFFNNIVTGPDPVIPETHMTGTPDPNQKTTKVHSSDKTTEKHENGVTDATTETPNPNEKFTCHSTGFFKDPKSPIVFHECIDVGNGKLKDQEFHCGVGTVYDEVNHVCKMP